MARKIKDTVEFSVNITGELSKALYTGTFSLAVSLSYKEMFREDEVRRGLLGANPQFADPSVDNVARTSAYLAVRLRDAPDWWKQSELGTSGPVGRDLNVLTDVYLAGVKALNEELKAISDAAEEDRKKLETGIEKSDKAD